MLWNCVSAFPPPRPTPASPRLHSHGSSSRPLLELSALHRSHPHVYLFHQTLNPWSPETVPLSMFIPHSLCKKVVDWLDKQVNTEERASEEGITRTPFDPRWSPWERKRQSGCRHLAHRAGLQLVWPGPPCTSLGSETCGPWFSDPRQLLAI